MLRQVQVGAGAYAEVDRDVIGVLPEGLHAHQIIAGHPFRGCGRFLADAYAEGNRMRPGKSGQDSGTGGEAVAALWLGQRNDRANLGETETQRRQRPKESTMLVQS